jgi:hypothetical protein
MNLLNVFNVLSRSGALFPALTLLAIAGIGWFGYQLYMGQRSGSEQQMPGGGIVDYGKKPISIWRNNKLYYMIAVFVLYIFAMTQVYSDYRDYNPKKDGVPKVQTDSTRMSAQDIINQQK